MSFIDAIRTVQSNHKQFYRAVFRRPEGGVSIMQIDPLGKDTLEDGVKHSLAVRFPGVTEFAIIHIDDLPNEKDYREAYVLNNGKCLVDLEKAKDIQRNRWREMREPLLKKSDVDLIRAIENGEAEKIKFLKQKRQVLRDVTDTELSHIVSLKGLRKVIPPVLTEEG